MKTPHAQYRVEINQCVLPPPCLQTQTPAVTAKALCGGRTPSCRTTRVTQGSNDKQSALNVGPVPLEATHNSSSWQLSDVRGRWGRAHTHTHICAHLNPSAESPLSHCGSGKAAREFQLGIPELYSYSRDRGRTRRGRIPQEPNWQEELWIIYLLHNISTCNLHMQDDYLAWHKHIVCIYKTHICALSHMHTHMHVLACTELKLVGDRKLNSCRQYRSVLPSFFNAHTKMYLQGFVRTLKTSLRATEMTAKYCACHIITHKPMAKRSPSATQTTITSVYVHVCVCVSCSMLVVFLHCITFSSSEG